jgi:hypothetical protein
LGKILGLSSPGLLAGLLPVGNFWSIDLAQAHMFFPALYPNQKCIPIQDLENFARKYVGGNKWREYQIEEERKKENPQEKNSVAARAAVPLSSIKHLIFLWEPVGYPFQVSLSLI